MASPPLPPPPLPPPNSFGDERSANMGGWFSSLTEATDSSNHWIVPTPHDVLLGRGKSNNHHPGNVRFNELIRSSCDAYYQTLNPVDRKQIISETVDRIVDQGGRFLKREQQQWIVVTREKALLKVAHAVQYMVRRRMDEYMDKAQPAVVEDTTNPLPRVPPHSSSLPSPPKSIRRPIKQPFMKQRRCTSLPSRLPVSTYSAFSHDYDFVDTASGINEGGQVPPFPQLSASYPQMRIQSYDSSMTDFIEPQPTTKDSLTTTTLPVTKKPEKDSTKQNDAWLFKPESTCSSCSLPEVPAENRRLRATATSIGSFDLEELNSSFADLDW